VEVYGAKEDGDREREGGRETKRRVEKVVYIL
jgi:hypothetical protein